MKREGKEEKAEHVRQRLTPKGLIFAFVYMFVCSTCLFMFLLPSVSSNAWY